MSIFNLKVKGSPGGLMALPSFGLPAPYLGYDEAKPSRPPLPRRKSSQVFTCWRWWRCVIRDGLPLLQSTFKGTLWEGPVMRSDTKPSAEDQMGIHGWFLFAAPTVGYDDPNPFSAYRALIAQSLYGKYTTAPKADPSRIYYPIAGEVELFGRCIVHERGVRGERARIKRLVVYPRHMPFCRPETITQLADRYDCPVEIGVWYEGETKEEKSE